MKDGELYSNYRRSFGDSGLASVRLNFNDVAGGYPSNPIYKKV
jgi:hypothetical protein